MNEVRTLIWRQVFRKRNVSQQHVSKKSYSQQLQIAHTSMALDTNLKQKLTQDSSTDNSGAFHEDSVWQGAEQDVSIRIYTSPVGNEFVTCCISSIETLCD